jgi:hypothetical protein
MRRKFDQAREVAAATAYHTGQKLLHETRDQVVPETCFGPTRRGSFGQWQMINLRTSRCLYSIPLPSVSIPSPVRACRRVDDGGYEVQAERLRRQSLIRPPTHLCFLVGSANSIFSLSISHSIDCDTSSFQSAMTLISRVSAWAARSPTACQSVGLLSSSRRIDSTASASPYFALATNSWSRVIGLSDSLDGCSAEASLRTSAAGLDWQLVSSS